MISPMELQARAMINAYREMLRNEETHYVTRQSLLNAIAAIWSESFSLDRVVAVANVLNNTTLSREDAQNELTKMARGKLLRRRAGRYEIAL